jgi:hypothetical protein
MTPDFIVTHFRSSSDFLHIRPLGARTDAAKIRPLLEFHIDVYFRCDQLRNLRCDDVRQVIPETAQETILEIVHCNRSNHILFKLRAFLAAQWRSIRCFRIAGKRVAEGLKLLLQAIETLQRNDHFAVGSTETHHKVSHPTDRVFEAQNVIEQERSEYGEECSNVVF